MKLDNRTCPLLALMFLVVGCTAAPVFESASPASRPAAVAMPDSYSAQIAADVLNRGGNAVDVAIAVAFSLAVTYPEAGSIAGGGFMNVYFEGESEFLDYRETAPAAATRTMYLDDRDDVVENASTVGHLSVGVPGTVAGMWAAHERYGSLPWSDLLTPAIVLARDGFVVHPDLADEIEDDKPRFAGRTNFDTYFGDVSAGQLHRQHDLAETLARIAERGPADFYHGETARLILQEMRANGGILSAEDLESYRTIWRRPIDTEWRNYRLQIAPLPSSGGFAIVQLLLMKEFLADAFAGLPHNSAQYIHLKAEMEKRVFADRAEYLGDPEFVEVPIETLIDASYIERRANEVSLDTISNLPEIAPGIESPHTVHFSVLDHHGNAVANTYTINTDFGSGVVVEGGGFLLNNQMDDFAIKPGVPNYYGVVGNDSNAIEPGKRMLSSMSPSILLRQGEVAMVVGAMGGSTIPTSVYQAVVNIIDFGMEPVEAVAATRVHHQLLPPDLIVYPPNHELTAATMTGLSELGYRIQEHYFSFGNLQLIWVNELGQPQAASDPDWRGESRVIQPAEPSSR